MNSKNEPKESLGLVEFGHLHLYVSRIASNLLLFPASDIPFLIKALHKYALAFLRIDERETATCSDKRREKEKDLGTMKNSIIEAMNLISPAIIIESTKFFLSFFPDDYHLRLCTQHLLRFLNMSSEIKMIILEMLSRISELFPEIIRGNIRSLFLFRLDRSYTKIKKIKLLAQLVSDSNFDLILNEISYHINSRSKELASVCIEAIGTISISCRKNQKKGLKFLFTIIKNCPKEQRVSEAVFQLLRIIKKSDEKQESSLPIISYIMHSLEKVKSPLPKINFYQVLPKFIVKSSSVFSIFCF